MLRIMAFSLVWFIAVAAAGQTGRFGPPPSTPLDAVGYENWWPDEWPPRAELIRRQIEAGADPNARDGSGRTPLHVAISKRLEASVRVLLELGADPNATDHFGRTPLELAIPNRGERLLYEHGARTDFRDRFGRSIYHLGGWWRCDLPDDVIERLRKDPERFRRLDNLGRSEIHCRLGDSEDTGVVAEYLAAGGDPNIRDNLGRGILFYVRAPYDPSGEGMMKTWIAAGADPNLSDSRGFRPLHIFAANNDIRGMEALVAASADLNAETENGETPLHLARLFGQKNAEAWLLERGARIQIEAPVAHSKFPFAEMLGELDYQVWAALGGSMTEPTPEWIDATTFRLNMTDIYPEALVRSATLSGGPELKGMERSDAASRAEAGFEEVSCVFDVGDIGGISIRMVRRPGAAEGQVRAALDAIRNHIRYKTRGAYRPAIHAFWDTLRVVDFNVDGRWDLYVTDSEAMGHGGGEWFLFPSDGKGFPRHFSIASAGPPEELQLLDSGLPYTKVFWRGNPYSSTGYEPVDPESGGEGIFDAYDGHGYGE